MSAAIDTEHYRKRLLEERERMQEAVDYLHEENPGSLEDETQEIQSDNHPGDMAAAERPLGARAAQWVELGAVVLAAIAADQLTKLIVTNQLSLDESLHVVGPFSIHHVQNSGIAFGLFSSATVAVTALTALAVGWMLLFFARSGARHPVLPVALVLLIRATTSKQPERIQAENEPTILV